MSVLSLLPFTCHCCYYWISYQHSPTTRGHEQEGSHKEGGKGWQMIRVRHRREGVAQEGRSSSCVWRERSETKRIGSKTREGPPVEDLKPVRRYNRSKAPLRYRAAEADEDRTTTGQINPEKNSGLLLSGLFDQGWFPRWQHGCSGGHFDHADQAEDTVQRYVHTGQR